MPRRQVRSSAQTVRLEKVRWQNRFPPRVIPIPIAAMPIRLNIVCALGNATSTEALWLKRYQQKQKKKKKKKKKGGGEIEIPIIKLKTKYFYKKVLLAEDTRRAEIQTTVLSDYFSSRVR